MGTNAKARAAATILVLFAVGIGLWRNSSRKSPAESHLEPQDAVYEMLRAARAGDVDSYLASFTGEMERLLRQTVRETSKAEFGRYLKAFHSDVKGIAVSDPDRAAGGEIKIRIEYVYQDRNEAQIVYLENAGSGWKIASTENQERVRTLIPYGTPVK